MVGLTVGERYLAWRGVLNVYPDPGRHLANELDDAIMEAAEDVVRDWAARDPLLRALLSEDCRLWAWEKVRAGDLPSGTMIRAPGRYRVTWTGRVKPRSSDPRYPWRDISWAERPLDAASDERYGPGVKLDDVVEALVPIPFDMSGLPRGRGR